MARAPKDATREIATLATDPLRWWYGGRIQNEDTVLAARGAGKGLWLYDELARDPKAGSALDKRKLALIGREWELEPADDSAPATAAMEMVRTVLDGLRFNQLVEDLLDAVLKGIAIAEIVWTATDAGIVPARIVARDPRRFAFQDVEGGEAELRLLTRAAPIDGIALPARKFIAHRHGGRYGSPWGLGLGQRLFWPVFFKRQGIGFWLGAVEKFAAPTPLGRYPAGTSEADQKRLLEALGAIAREAAVIVPEGMAIELIEAKRSGAFDSYERLARYMDEDIATTVLGETLTSSAGEAGSRALGEVHNEVRLELVKADADALSDTLNTTLIAWLVEINMPGAPSPRIWWDFDAADDLTARAERDVKVKSLGFRPTPDYIREHYGEGWEEAAEPAGRGKPSSPGGGPQGGPTQGEGAARDALAELFAEPRWRTQPRDAADDLTEQLADAAADLDDPLFRAIEALVARADSLQAIADGLVALVPSIGNDRLAELMAQALAVAELTGRADLVSEA